MILPQLLITKFQYQNRSFRRARLVLGFCQRDCPTSVKPSNIPQPFIAPDSSIYIEVTDPLSLY